MPIPTSVADLSTTPASNYPAGGDAIGTSLDDYLRTIQAIIKQQDSKGSDIASSTTITVPNAGSYFVVTGTTTIATIADNWNGRMVSLKFSGALQLTHSTGLILPRSANITTAAGDCLLAVNESTGVWRVVAFQPAAGLANAGANADITGLSAIAAGTAALPSITPTGDPNTGVWFPAADTFALSTGGSERMRIDSGGNVGIGKTAAGGVVLDANGVIRSTQFQSPNNAGTYTSGSAGFHVFPFSDNNLYFNWFDAGDIVFRRASNAESVRIKSTGGLEVVAAAGLGYGTGAGGTVTQATSKTTAVTLNKPTGQITMNNAALAGSTAVVFALNNSLITGVDCLVVNPTGFGNYITQVVNTATGAASIRVTNITGGSLSEAVTLQFAIIKGAAL